MAEWPNLPDSMEGVVQLHARFGASNPQPRHLAVAARMNFPSMPAPDRLVSLPEPVCHPGKWHERAEEVVEVAVEALPPGVVF
jgi:hypothetical protein